MFEVRREEKGRDAATTPRKTTGQQSMKQRMDGKEWTMKDDVFLFSDSEGQAWQEKEREADQK